MVRLSARLFARLFALAKRLLRVSDRIICMALRKTLSETCFFTRSSTPWTSINFRARSAVRSKGKGPFYSSAIFSISRHRLTYPIVDSFHTLFDLNYSLNSPTVFIPVFKFYQISNNKLNKINFGH